jgi:RecA-family ATPase
MKTDVNDTLREHGPDAVRERHDQAKKYNGSKSEQTKPAAPLVFINPGSPWSNKPIPPREWSTRDRFPLRQVALLSGEGAIGKSIVLMQVCAAHALGRDWLGAMPEHGPAIYLGCEDETDELHRRLADIVAYYGAQMSDLADLHLLSLVASTLPPLLAWPRAAVALVPRKDVGRRIEADQLWLDVAGRLSQPSEQRRHVRQFISILRGMAIAANCTVLVCSHPSLTGISSGSGLSGSTAWHNSVRARAYMHTAATESGAEPDPELRQLDFPRRAPNREDANWRSRRPRGDHPGPGPPIRNGP